MKMDFFSLKQRIFLVKQFYQEFGNFNCVKNNYEDLYGNSANQAFSREVLFEIIKLFEETGNVCSDQQVRTSYPELRKDRDAGKGNHISPSADVPFECEACDKTFLYFNNLKRHVLESHELLDVYKCDVCLVDFRRKHKLVAHMKSHDDERTYEGRQKYKQCEECGKLCSITAYELHMMTHYTDQPQKCHICGKTYNWKCGYILHIMKHKGIGEEDDWPKCEVCGLAMAGERTLKLHMEKSHPVARRKQPIVINVPNQIELEYEECKEEATDAMDYEDHDNFTDTPQVPHSETIVVLPFDSANDDVFNMNTCEPTLDESDDDYWPADDLFKNTVEPPKPTAESNFNPELDLCEVCGKVFKGKHVLKNHMRTHMSSFDYKCTYEGCHRIFKTSGAYQWHIRAHKKHAGNSHKCTLCPKSYLFYYLLKNHIVAAHNAQTFACKFCNRVFIERSDLDFHLTEMHDLTQDAIQDIAEECRSLAKEMKPKQKPFKCIVCDKGFRQHNLMKKHMKCHEKSDEALMCPEPGCGRSFPIQKYLSLHLLRHTDVRYKCAHCDKDYKDRNQMKRHIQQVHLKEDPRYKCHICPYAVWHSGTFRRHMKRHHNIDDPFPNAKKSSRCFVLK